MQGIREMRGEVMRKIMSEWVRILSLALLPILFSKKKIIKKKIMSEWVRIHSLALLPILFSKCDIGKGF